MTTSRAEPPGLASPPPPQRLAGGGAAGALYQGEGRGRRGRVGVLAGPGFAGRPRPARATPGGCGRRLLARGLGVAGCWAGGRIKSLGRGEGSRVQRGVCVGSWSFFGSGGRSWWDLAAAPPSPWAPIPGSQPARPFSTLVLVQPRPSPPLE